MRSNSVKICSTGNQKDIQGNCHQAFIEYQNPQRNYTYNGGKSLSCQLMTCLTKNNDFLIDVKVIILVE
jgi:hypothetical protein